MKPHMLLEGKQTYFRAPYYIHDTISVYDKSAKKYVARRRTTGISLSDTEEILISMAICSSNDVFSKEIGRNIVNGRLRKAIRKYNNDSDNNVIYTASPTNSTYVFTDVDSFIQYCDTLDAMANQFFSPYHIEYSDHPDNSPELIRLSRVSYTYLHRAFVVDAVREMAEALVQPTNLDTETLASGKEEARSNKTNKQSDYLPVSAGKS